MLKCQCINASGANKGSQCSYKSKPNSRFCGVHSNCNKSLDESPAKAEVPRKPVSPPKVAPKPVSPPKVAAKPVSPPKVAPKPVRPAKQKVKIIRLKLQDERQIADKLRKQQSERQLADKQQVERQIVDKLRMQQAVKSPKRRVKIIIQGKHLAEGQPADKPRKQQADGPVAKPKSPYPFKFIYHCTDIKYLDQILSSGYLYTQSDRARHGIVSTGEGATGRRIARADISLIDPEYWRHYQEAEGVYFRIAEPKCKSAVLVFKLDLLDKLPWHYNTSENNGFYLGPLGVMADGPFSGDLGATYDRSNIHTCPNLDYKDGHELIVTQSVPLSYLDHIIVK